MRLKWLWMVLVFVFLAGCNSLVAKSGTNTKDAVIFDVYGLSFDQRITVEILQGLVNREGPRLILGYSDYWSDTKWNYKWVDIYEKQYGMKFKKVEGLLNLLKRFRKSYSGLVVYDPAIDGTRRVAATLAGVENLLPVSEPEPYTKELGLKVVRDMRGKFSDSVEAYQWALENVMPRCNRSSAHIGAGPDVDGLYIGWGFLGMDFCVMNKGFLFNLTFLYEDKGSFFRRKIKANKRQADMYRRILEALQKPAFIIGYGEPEHDWFTLVGEYGHYYLHWGDNLSFHAQVPAKKPEFHQNKHFTVENVDVEPEKYYVCFVTSEGDSMKGPVPFFFDSWFDKKRGTVPINWAIPWMMDEFPAMLEYYYQTATDNDYFVGVQVYNFNMPNLEQFAQIVRDDMHRSDLRLLSGAFCFPSTHQQQKSRFFTIVEPLGVFDIVYDSCPYEGYQKFIGDNNDIPLVGTGYLLAYWHRILGGWDAPWIEMIRNLDQRQSVIDKLVAEIEKVAAYHKPPFIVLVYGDLHKYERHCTFYSDVAKMLDTRRFKVARMDEAFAAIRKWKSQQPAETQKSN